MGADRITELHVRAAGWFSDHDMPERAIVHALQAGDLEAAACAMERGLCEALNREDRQTLERWLQQLPEESIAKSPELLVMRGWAHAFRWEIEQIARRAEQAEALLDEADLSHRTQLLRGQIAFQKGQFLFHINRHDRAVACCQESLALLPEEWRYVRGNAAVYLGMGLYAGGRAGDAESYLLGQYESAGGKTDSFSLRLLLALTANYLSAGKYEIAERTARAMLRQAAASGLPTMEAWGHYMLGFIRYEWNDLEEAGRCFEKVTDMLYTAQSVVVRNGLFGQALVAQALGRAGDALGAIDRLSQIDLEYSGHEADSTAAARAGLLFRQGDWEGAERWADLDTAPPADRPFLPWMEEPRLTQARILIAGSRPGDVQAALSALDALDEIAERTFNSRVKIKILALRALAQLTQGDSAGAHESLIRSVELARRGLFTRVYVDLGSQMRKLLRQIVGHDSIAKTAGHILAAFPGDEAAPAGQTGYETANPGFSSSANGTEESLTLRECEVLILMAEPIGLKVIAARLNISYATARRYTINIYSKFGVHSRWAAVDCAIRKGIIPPR
jgi:LuxR family maltose regulon positive regulatory protein